MLRLAHWEKKKKVGLICGLVQDEVRVPVNDYWSKVNVDVDFDRWPKFDF